MSGLGWGQTYSPDFLYLPLSPRKESVKNEKIEIVKIRKITFKCNGYFSKY